MLRIKIVDVGAPTAHQAANGLEYEAIEVIFRDTEEQVKSWRLFSWKNKHVYKAARTWTKGTEVDVEVQEDKRGYEQWVNTTKVSSTSIEEDDVPF